MAQKPLSTAAAERMNLVAQDEIWRYRLKAESEARQNWAQNWGFLTTPLEELLQGEAEAPSPKPKVELPERFRIRPGTPVEKYIKVRKPFLDTCLPKSSHLPQSRRPPKASSAGGPGFRASTSAWSSTVRSEAAKGPTPESWVGPSRASTEPAQACGPWAPRPDLAEEELPSVPEDGAPAWVPMRCGKAHRGRLTHSHQCLPSRMFSEHTHLG